MKIFRPQEWQEWGLYISFSSTVIAVMGVYFGALIPLVKFLSLKKALIWFAICIVAFCLLYLKMKYLSRVDHSFDVKKATYKLVIFGLIWSLFPFIVCSAVNFSGESTKNCFCEKIPPTINVSFRKHGNLLQIIDKGAVRKIIKRIKKQQPIEVQYIHPGEMSRLLNNLDTRRETNCI